MIDEEKYIITLRFPRRIDFNHSAGSPILVSNFCKRSSSRIDLVFTQVQCCRAANVIDIFVLILKQHSRFRCILLLPFSCLSLISHLSPHSSSTQREAKIFWREISTKTAGRHRAVMSHVSRVSRKFAPKFKDEVRVFRR